MNTSKPRHVILAVCAAVFFYQLWHIAGIRASQARIEQDAAALGAQVKNRNSASHITSMFLKSVFDGFTFGRFAEEGIFTEYNKETRFDDSTTQKAARLSTAHSQNLSEIRSAALIRNWSLGAGLIVIAYSFAAKKRKQMVSVPVQKRD